MHRLFEGQRQTKSHLYPHSRVTEPWCCLPVLLLRSLGLLLWCSWADLWAGGGCGPAMEADPASIASSARGTRNS